MKKLLITIAAVVLVGCGPRMDVWTEAKEGNVKAVRQHIGDGLDVNKKDTNGFTPIHHAAKYGQNDIIIILVNSGANINATRNNTKRRGITPLHDANQKSTVELLIEKGANVNSKCDNGSTPLHSAAITGNIHKAEILISNDSDVNAIRNGAQNKGATPLDLSVNMENTRKYFKSTQRPMASFALKSLEENIPTQNYEKIINLLLKYGGKTAEEINPKVNPKKVVDRKIVKMKTNSSNNEKNKVNYSVPDDDDDGVDNIDEWLLGTDPDDSNNRPTDSMISEIRLREDYVKQRVNKIELLKAEQN